MKILINGVSKVVEHSMLSYDYLVELTFGVDAPAVVAPLVTYSP